MTKRTFLKLWHSHPGARFALAIAALAVWLAWSLSSAPPAHHPAPAQSAPLAAASSAPISSPVRTVYKCVRRGHLPRLSDQACSSNELQMVEIPPSPPVGHR